MQVAIKSFSVPLSVCSSIGKASILFTVFKERRLTTLGLVLLFLMPAKECDDCNNQYNHVLEIHRALTYRACRHASSSLGQDSNFFLLLKRWACLFMEPSGSISFNRLATKDLGLLAPCYALSLCLIT